ncbi:MAG: hypothetical protein ACRYGL_05445, partial [Janthinobacterium lividum]
ESGVGAGTAPDAYGAGESEDKVCRCSSKKDGFRQQRGIFRDKRRDRPDSKQSLNARRAVRSISGNYIWRPLTCHFCHIKSLMHKADQHLIDDIPDSG